METYDVAVIGGGAAGMSAAVAAREKGASRVLILERDDVLGGVLNELIEPLTGWDGGLTGVELADSMAGRTVVRKVIVKTGTLVLSVTKDRIIKYVNGVEGVKEVEAKAIVFATGARERPRGILNISSKRSAGIMSVGSARKLIVNDGFLPGKNVVIYGGDRNGIYLARMLVVEGARRVTLVEPGKAFKNWDESMDRLIRYPGVDVKLGARILEISENGRITAVKIRTSTPEEMTEVIECDALLLSVGLDPSRRLFKRFRRSLDEMGMYTAGNAEEVSYDCRMAMESGAEAGTEAAAFATGTKQTE
ncbi:NAD(P)/FAD-dependent oxidoreductase [Youngiibacter fragilis]|uniref:FAD-dependent pyridine nucleotide-disulfide oxidoreductase n=1 Tax=Youngiibacter fragilis 232.1 TaxID=994573 RepID=V7I3I8_9CLOT|nr:NAD(P)/FAD-dependent oxidoreductase [Youngiibacter fragilis]ETA79749.1 FAD-dependent pyridine nucleotide-disulfide oxidoreductase [Youngiibacter fragilis 232.1]